MPTSPTRIKKFAIFFLSDDAEANSMPGLEILADNVRCTHGATSGQIEEDELFYLRTRGIPTKVAQRLLVTGFLDEVIQRLDHPAIAEHLHRLIEQKFARNSESVASGVASQASQRASHVLFRLLCLYLVRN